MSNMDTSFAVFGPDKEALKLLIAAVLCAELDEWPPEPRDDFDMAEVVKDKAERYALYLSLFFTVSRRRKREKQTEPPFGNRSQVRR